jgi:hypothetical protein
VPDPAAILAEEPLVVELSNHNNRGAFEKHFTFEEIAALRRVNKYTVRRLFTREPGVVALTNARPSSRRRYVTLRIPEGVVEWSYPARHLELAEPEQTTYTKKELNPEDGS